MYQVEPIKEGGGYCVGEEVDVQMYNAQDFSPYRTKGKVRLLERVLNGGLILIRVFVDDNHYFIVREGDKL